MGLDMYLSRQKYIGSIDWQASRGQDELVKNKQYLELIKVLGNPDVSDEGILVELPVGYWRKANHIHNWFVQNVQNGEDECKPHRLYKDKLEELKTVCNLVLDDPELADKLLPTASGFFFGGTDYDEYYFSDIKDTLEIIDRALASDSDVFTYQSSW